MRWLAATFLLGAAWLARAEENGRWRLQYFYDKEHANFAISDLKFPSAKRGVAVGAILDGHSVKPMSALTSDGGAHWSLVPLNEPGMSLFFLNDSLGWLVTTKGLWQTEESGRSWRKVKAPPGLLRVHFLDPEHGWAVGMRKQIYETKNGGVDWVKLPVVDQIESSQENTRFSWIEFVGKDVGIIGGSSRPGRVNSELPDWMEPEEASKRREWPHLAVTLETRDGGKSWKPSTASIFGEITEARFSTAGWGLGLIEFSGTFDWPSEVMFWDWKTGRQKRIYRTKDRKVTDVAITGADGPIYLAAVEHSGQLQQLVVPGKVKIIRSGNAKDWTEMDVDYHAVARRVILAAAGPNDIWAATVTGMILKLTQ
jgi:hypothetical protein